VKGWVGWILLVLSLLVAVAGFRNSRAEPETEEMARGVVCSVAEGCKRNSERPHTVRTDFVRRRYAWNTSVGPAYVVCTRKLILTGAWVCEAKQGEMPE
jgi:hypothetical protein